MTRIVTKTLILVLISNLAWLAVAGKGGIGVKQSKIFLPLPGSHMTAGYAHIENQSAKAIKVSVSRVDHFAKAELHRTYEKDGRVGMEKVDEVVIEAGKALHLMPGGYHLMLFDPQGELKDGQIAKVHLLVDGFPAVFEFKLENRVSDRNVEEHHSHH
ncbi:MAG: copper chaperone PCu(A)C [Bdellovibrionales bacterium]|nr:copper chaperone PCu(A)C [Bdellovibrionales bacterium]